MSNLPVWNGKAINLSSSKISVVIEPELGGKIRSFKSNSSGREYFLQVKNFTDTKTEFSNHDMSGMDECFPTITPGHHTFGQLGDIDMGDHGLLWSREWKAQIVEDRVEMEVTVPELDIIFRRSNRLLSESTLCLDYTIENKGKEIIPFIYCAHPLLPGTPKSRMIFPEAADDAYLEVALNEPGLPTDRGLIKPWATLKKAMDGPYDAAHNRCIKSYAANVKLGRVALEVPEAGERLVVEFTKDTLPHLGILVFEGYGPEDDAPYRKELFLAIEPGTSLGDDFTGATKTGTLGQVKPGSKYEFQIKFSLEKL